MNFFKDMVANGKLDTSNQLQMECLWFCFSKLIETELNEVKDNWNSHYIRDSRFQTSHGIPDKLYFLPDSVGKEDHKHIFDTCDLQEAENEFSSCDSCPSDDYRSYVTYVVETLGISVPNDWREGLATYVRLTTVAM